MFLSVISLTIELPLFQLGGSGFKLWMLAAVMGGIILLLAAYEDGCHKLLESKILWLGLGLMLFSALGIINSPLKAYSLKQLIILTALVVLGVFFELNIKKYSKEALRGLFWGILISSAYAIYQNIAFNLGWPNFETMAARPNAFFPEADWLGIYLALGLVPFLVMVFGERPDGTFDRTFFQNKYILYFFSLAAVSALIITVARASWLAFLAEWGIIVLTLAYIVIIPTKAARLHGKQVIRKNVAPRIKSENDKLPWEKIYGTIGIFASLILISLVLISIFNLSRFDIPDRFRSIFLKEHIVTVAVNPETGEKTKINLEDKETYRNQGYQIQEEYTGDENVASREEKFASTWDTIKAHPFLGSGLGITLINTRYQHNANNLFLEWWASAGIGGILLVTGFLIYLIIKGFNLISQNLFSAQIVLAGTAGFIIVNLFNASILLAFAWFYLAWLLAELTSFRVKCS